MRAALLQRMVLLLWIILLLSLFAGSVRSDLQAGLPAGHDFMNLWAAPRLALTGRLSDAYDIGRLDAFKRAEIGGSISTDTYNYPPVAALVTLPFALLPYWLATIVWLGGGCLVLAAVVRATLPIADCRLPIADCRLPIADCRMAAAVLYVLALPAVLVNASLGQNGTWTAGLLGGGLTLVGRRPVLGGVVLGLLIAKPQLAVLVPFALLAGRRWRALAACAATALCLVAVTAALFGTAPWLDFAHFIAFVRQAVLENGGGTGVALFFPSVFSLVRSLTASSSLAYAAQGVAALAVVATVVTVWRSAASEARKYAVLVLATFFATPYALVYDLVVTALVPLWLCPDISRDGRWQPLQLVAVGLLLLAPFAGPLLSSLTGEALTLLFLMPMLAVSLWRPSRRPLSAPPPPAPPMRRY